MNSQKITVRSIAKAAGVSQTTVSLALRNDPRIILEKRNRIQEIAQKLGYRVNPFVSAFMSSLKEDRHQKLTTIAYLAQLRPADTKSPYPNPDNIGHPGTRNMARERAQQLHYKFETFYMNAPGMTGERLTKILHTRNIRGILIGPAGHDIPLSLDWSIFSSVVLGHSLIYSHLNRVASDIYYNASLALRSLHQLGYRRIGLFIREQSDRGVDRRYLSAYLTHHHALKIKKFIPPYFEDRDKGEKILKWYKKYSPDVIMTLAPRRLLSVFHKLGIDVPQKVGIASLNSAGDENVSGIDSSVPRIGAIGVEMLEGQLIRNEHGIPQSPTLTLVPGKWIDGPTTRQQ